MAKSETIGAESAQAQATTTAPTKQDAEFIALLEKRAQARSAQRTTYLTGKYDNGRVPVIVRRNAKTGEYPLSVEEMTTFKGKGAVLAYHATNNKTTGAETSTTYGVSIAPLFSAIMKARGLNLSFAFIMGAVKKDLALLEEFHLFVKEATQENLKQVIKNLA